MSRSLNFLDRFRSKSFDKNLSTITTSYQYIDNFDTVSEDDCIKLDMLNREIYKRNMHLFNNINKKIENNNAMFKIDSPPIPPSDPNNHDRYISYKLRNINNNVRYQSYATCYLINKGYRLHFDKPEYKSDKDFEPYEAIELFQKLENTSIDNIFRNKTYNPYFIPLYNTYEQSSPMIMNNRKTLYLNPPHYSSSQEIYPPLSASAPSIFNMPEETKITSTSPIISAPPALHYIK